VADAVYRKFHVSVDPGVICQSEVPAAGLHSQFAELNPVMKLRAVSMPAALRTKRLRVGTGDDDTLSFRSLRSRTWYECGRFVDGEKATTGRLSSWLHSVGPVTGILQLPANPNGRNQKILITEEIVSIPAPLQCHHNSNRKCCQKGQHQVFLEMRRFPDSHISPQ
jgi:hypothetical protein